MWKWEAGRQNTGYYKMTLWAGPWFDLHLLKYPLGSFIHLHRDEVKTGQHYRLNVELVKSSRGGKFICGDVIYRKCGVCLFRPDESTHGVTRVFGNTRYVLSLGWVKNT